MAAKCNAKWRTIHISSNSLPPCLDGERSGFRVASSGRPGARSGGPHTGRGSSLSSSPLNWRGRGLVPCAAHLALCFCCCRAGASCSCGWRRCPQFHSSLLGMEQVSMPSASETTQQPTRPRASKGNQAAPLASASPPPVQCTIPNPLAFFLILVFFTGRKGGDFYRYAH